LQRDQRFVPAGIGFGVMPALELRNAQRSGGARQQITRLIGLTRVNRVLCGIQLPAPGRGHRIGTGQAAQGTAGKLQQHRALSSLAKPRTALR
jgi:hypothetical protein